MRFSIRTKLVVAICLPLLAVYLTVLVIEYREGKRQAIDQTQSHLAELTAHYAAHLDKELSTVAQVARSTDEFLEAFPLDEKEEIYRLLRSNLRNNPNIFGTCLAMEPGAFKPDLKGFAPYVYRTPSGELQDMDIAAEAYDYTRWDWYLLPKLLDKPAWTDPYFDTGAGDALMCTYSTPLKRDGKFQGVVTVDVSLEHLRQEMSKVRIRGGYCFVVSQTGTFVSYPDKSFIMCESLFSLAEWHKLPELVDLGREMTAGRSGVRRIADFETGRPRWIVFAPVESVGWSLAAVIPEEHVMSTVYDRMNRQMVLLLTGLVLLVIVILLVVTWITRPIKRLAAVAGEVAQGKLDVRVTGVKSRDEIGQFTQTFNQMVTDLKANVEARINETSARQAMERELQVARQIQTSLLPMTRPPYPHRDEFSLHADNEPARFMAGDFFDFWFVEDDLLALVMADVSGKGVPAAMFMAVARTIIRSVSVPGRSPGEILTVTNRVMAEDNEEQMFVTVFYAHYNVKTGELLFANGGHNPPYIVRKDGKMESLGASTGPLVGVWDDARFGNEKRHLDPGDLLLLYTDGVTEAHNEKHEMFGEIGLQKLLAEIHGRPVGEICQAIIDKVDQHRNNEGQDDVTLLALRRRR